MTAKEMFEKLGYKLIINNKDDLTYEKIVEKENKNYHLKERFTIVFEKKEKFIGHYYEQYSKYNDMWTYELCYLDIKELQAINQQVKELGWNER